MCRVVGHGDVGVWSTDACLAGQAWRVVAHFLYRDDVLFGLKDPLPFLLQARSILKNIVLGRKQGITALQESTFDIEWNGQGE